MLLFRRFYRQVLDVIIQHRSTYKLAVNYNVEVGLQLNLMLSFKYNRQSLICAKTTSWHSSPKIRLTPKNVKETPNWDLGPKKNLCTK
jgi:hypothetical protein